MSGKELMDTSIIPCNFSTCSSSWATPQPAPASSLGTRSFKMSLPFRSAWGMGYGRERRTLVFLGFFWPGWVLEGMELNAASVAGADLNQREDGSPSAFYPPIDPLGAMGDLHWLLSVLPAWPGAVAPQQRGLAVRLHPMASS